MAPDHPRSNRITVDKLFAPAPHGLITDVRVSPPAFRLWCVLHMMAWLREPPDVDRLQDRMNHADPPTRRSIYRWLGELEAAGWLEWQRSPGRAGVNDRFALKTDAAPDRIGGEGVTLVSQDAEPVIVESQPVIVRSQVVTLRSQVPPIHPLSEQAKHATQNHENHENHGGGGDRARASTKQAPLEPLPPHVAYLIEQGVGAAAEFSGLDPDAVIADFEARRADGQTKATIVRAWRLRPPAPGAIYERRPTHPEPSSRQSGRRAVAAHNPDRDAEYAAQLAIWEHEAAERGRSD